MEHIAPLLQTVLWVGLIAVIMYRFHRPIDGLLTALQKRIEGGGTVKAGPFELGELKSQDPAQQLKRADSEIRELLQSDGVVDVVSSNERSASVKSRFFEAEDLALRAIQAEYGKPISRQVSAGADMGFDGVFTTSRGLNVVEVKYVVKEKNAYMSVRKALNTIVNFFERQGLQNVFIIVAVVFEHAGDLAAATAGLNISWLRMRLSL